MYPLENLNESEWVWIWCYWQPKAEALIKTHGLCLKRWEPGPMKHPSDSRSLGDPGLDTPLKGNFLRVHKETALGIGQFYHPGRFCLLLCKVLWKTCLPSSEHGSNVDSPLLPLRCPGTVKARPGSPWLSRCRCPSGSATVPQGWRLWTLENPKMPVKIRKNGIFFWSYSVLTSKTSTSPIDGVIIFQIILETNYTGPEVFTKQPPWHKKVVPPRDRRDHDLRGSMGDIGRWGSREALSGEASPSHVGENGDLGLSENSVPLHPMVLLIIIPTKWL